MNVYGACFQMPIQSLHNVWGMDKTSYYQALQCSNCLHIVSHKQFEQSKFRQILFIMEPAHVSLTSGYLHNTDGFQGAIMKICKSERRDQHA